MTQTGRPRRRTAKGGLTRNVVLLVAFVLAAPSAIAAGKQSREQVARKACLTGDYTKGIDILSDLFIETNNAIYIFNQGRCLQQNQQYRDAIARFQEYLRTDTVHPLNPEEKETAEKHIASCRVNLAEQAGLPPNPPPPSPPPPAVTPIPAPGPAPAAETPPVAMVQTEPSSTPTNPGSGLRITGLVLASVGVAALGTGVGFNWLANDKISEMESTDGYSDSKKSSYDTYMTLTWVGYGVGAACLATGAVLYGIGLGARSKSADADRVAIVPTLGRGATGMALVGVF